MKIIRANTINIEKFNDKENLLTTPIEAISNFIEIEKNFIQHVSLERDGYLLKCYMHPFVQAIHYAYSYHLPLNLTPDMIWYLISNTIAVHMNKFSDESEIKYLSGFVKEKINVRRDDFEMNSENPWNELIDEFSSVIHERIDKEIATKLVPDFSTTNKLSKIMSQIVLTGSIEKHFEFGFTTMCGIPEIRVKGTKQDWLNIKTKTNGLFALLHELNFWKERLNDVLNNFIDIFDDKVDNKFWNNMYKIEGGSGGPYITGWMTSLFPYLVNKKEKRYILSENLTWKTTEGMLNGLTTDAFYFHMNQVPFNWQYFGTITDMMFIGGMIGIICESQDDSLTPIFGYAVTQNTLKDPDFYQI